MPVCVVSTVQCSLRKYKKCSTLTRQAKVKQEQGEVDVSVTNIIQLRSIHFFINTRKIEGILVSERRIRKLLL